MSEDNTNSNANAAPMWNGGSSALPVTHGGGLTNVTIDGEPIDLSKLWVGDDPVYHDGGGTATFNAAASPEFIDALMPEILRRLAHPEARAIAEAAVADPKEVDRLALSALADWLEERMYGDIAGRVRRLAAQDGDILLVTIPESPHFGTYEVEVQESLSKAVNWWADMGIKVAWLTIRDDAKVELLRPRMGRGVAG